MKVDKLQRLFDALDSPARKSQQNANASNVTPIRSDSGGAVKLSSDFGQSKPEAIDARSQRVSELKTAVSDGSFNVDSKDVAKALLRDLF